MHKVVYSVARSTCFAKRKVTKQRATRLMKTRIFIRYQFAISLPQYAPHISASSRRSRYYLMCRYTMHRFDTLNKHRQVVTSQRMTRACVKPQLATRDGHIRPTMNACVCTSARTRTDTFLSFSFDWLCFAASLSFDWFSTNQDAPEPIANYCYNFRSYIGPIHGEGA